MLDQAPTALTDHQRAILSAVLAQPALRRGEVSQQLGISAQTTMRAVLPLIEQGILSEHRLSGGGRGKPAHQLGFVAGSLATIGISLAVDRVRIEIEDLDGAPLSSASRTGTYDNARVQLADLDAQLETAVAALSRTTRVMAAGVSVQGYLMAGGTRFAAKADPEGWSRIDLPGHLSDRLGMPVQLMNDGRTLASSLIRSSPFANYICLHIGSGIGGGVVSNGGLVPGANGNAGEFGALFPDGPDRPVEPAFLRAFGLDSWADWRGLTATPPAFLDLAAARISRAITGVLPLLDFEAVYLCSRMPADLLSAFCDRIRIEPLGLERFGGVLAAQNPAPVVVAHHVPNYARLACRMAVDAVLRPAIQPNPGG